MSDWSNSGTGGLVAERPRKPGLAAGTVGPVGLPAAATGCGGDMDAACAIFGIGVGFVADASGLDAKDGAAEGADAVFAIAVGFAAGAAVTGGAAGIGLAVGGIGLTVGAAVADGTAGAGFAVAAIALSTEGPGAVRVAPGLAVKGFAVAD